MGRHISRSPNLARVAYFSAVIFMLCTLSVFPLLQQTTLGVTLSSQKQGSITAPTTADRSIPPYSTPPFPQPLPELYVYVNSTVFSGITASLNQYVQDGLVTGYNVTTFRWSSTNVIHIRGNLTARYNAIGTRFKGVLLVGKIPHLQYEANLTNFQTYPDVAYDAFPCDYYLMDESVVIRVGDKNFRISAEPDINYSADEV